MLKIIKKINTVEFTLNLRSRVLRHSVHRFESAF